jgi:hypothetical protein
MPIDTDAFSIDEVQSTNAIVARVREQRNYMFLVITSGRDFGRMLQKSGTYVRRSNLIAGFGGQRKSVEEDGGKYRMGQTWARDMI